MNGLWYNTEAIFNHADIHFLSVHKGIPFGWVMCNLHYVGCLTPWSLVQQPLYMQATMESTVGYCFTMCETQKGLEHLKKGL
jgi:hypothetical protein